MWIASVYSSNRMQAIFCFPRYWHQTKSSVHFKWVTLSSSFWHIYLLVLRFTASHIHERIRGLIHVIMPPHVINTAARFASWCLINANGYTIPMYPKNTFIGHNWLFCLVGIDYAKSGFCQYTCKDMAAAGFGKQHGKTKVKDDFDPQRGKIKVNKEQCSTV